MILYESEIERRNQKAGGHSRPPYSAPVVCNSSKSRFQSNSKSGQSPSIQFHPWIYKLNSISTMWFLLWFNSDSNSIGPKNLGIPITVPLPESELHITALHSDRKDACWILISFNPHCPLIDLVPGIYLASPSLETHFQKNVLSAWSVHRKKN